MALNLQSKGKIYITKDKGTLFLLCIQKMKMAFQRPECAPRREHRRENSSFHLQEVKQSFMPKPSSWEATAGSVSSIWLRTQKYMKPHSIFEWRCLFLQIISTILTLSFCKHQKKLWFMGFTTFNIQIPCFVAFTPNCYLLWTKVVCISLYRFVSEIQNQASRVSFLSPSTEHCTCIKIMAQHESLKIWIDQNYKYNRRVFYILLFNSLVHLLRVMNRTIYLTFTELLEFTKPSGISFTLCVHIINKLFSCIFLCAEDMCQVYVWLRCLCLWSKSI